MNRERELRRRKGILDTQYHMKQWWQKSGASRLVLGETVRAQFVDGVRNQLFEPITHLVVERTKHSGLVVRDLRVKSCADRVVFRDVLDFMNHWSPIFLAVHVGPARSRTSLGEFLEAHAHWTRSVMKLRPIHSESRLASNEWLFHISKDTPSTRSQLQVFLEGELKAAQDRRSEAVSGPGLGPVPASESSGFSIEPLSSSSSSSSSLRTVTNDDVHSSDNPYVGDNDDSLLQQPLPNVQFPPLLLPHMVKRAKQQQQERDRLLRQLLDKRRDEREQLLRESEQRKRLEHSQSELLRRLKAIRDEARSNARLQSLATERRMKPSSTE
jgi:hypothetical protein